MMYTCVRAVALSRTHQQTSRFLMTNYECFPCCVLGNLSLLPARVVEKRWLVRASGYRAREDDEATNADFCFFAEFTTLLLQVSRPRGVRSA